MKNRIDRITSTLRSITSIEGKFTEPTNLRDRMKHYHTPSVSIAIINNFEIEWAQGFRIK
jgi:hypothetical protein